MASNKLTPLTQGELEETLKAVLPGIIGAAIKTNAPERGINKTEMLEIINYALGKIITGADVSKAIDAANFNKIVPVKSDIAEILKQTVSELLPKQKTDFYNALIEMLPSLGKELIQIVNFDPIRAGVPVKWKGILVDSSKKLLTVHLSEIQEEGGVIYNVFFRGVNSDLRGQYTVLYYIPEEES